MNDRKVRIEYCKGQMLIALAKANLRIAKGEHKCAESHIRFANECLDESDRLTRLEYNIPDSVMGSLADSDDRFPDCAPSDDEDPLVPMTKECPDRDCILYGQPHNHS